MENRFYKIRNFSHLDNAGALILFIILCPLLLSGFAGAASFILFMPFLLIFGIPAYFLVKLFLLGATIDRFEKVLIIPKFNIMKFSIEERKIPLRDIRKIEYALDRRTEYVNPVKGPNGAITKPGHYVQRRQYQIKVLAAKEWFIINSSNELSARNFIEELEDSLN